MQQTIAMNVPATQSTKEIARNNDGPHGVSKDGAVGTFASFLQILGFDKADSNSNRQSLKKKTDENHSEDAASRKKSRDLVLHREINLTDEALPAFPAAATVRSIDSECGSGLTLCLPHSIARNSAIASGIISLEAEMTQQEFQGSRSELVAAGTRQRQAKSTDWQPVNPKFDSSKVNKDERLTSAGGTSDSSRILIADQENGTCKATKNGSVSETLGTGFSEVNKPLLADHAVPAARISSSNVGNPRTMGTTPEGNPLAAVPHPSGEELSPLRASGDPPVEISTPHQFESQHSSPTLKNKKQSGAVAFAHEVQRAKNTTRTPISLREGVPELSGQVARRDTSLPLQPVRSVPIYETPDWTSKSELGSLPQSLPATIVASTKTPLLGQIEIRTHLRGSSPSAELHVEQEHSATTLASSATAWNEGQSRSPTVNIDVKHSPMSFGSSDSRKEQEGSDKRPQSSQERRWKQESESESEEPPQPVIGWRA